MHAHNLIAGLAIIDNLRPVHDTPFHIRAEHDCIYAGSLDWPISPETLSMLKTLGWSPEEEAEGYRASV